MSAAQKLSISEGLKRYWAAKGKAAKGGKGKGSKKASTHLTAHQKAVLQRDHLEQLRKSNALARSKHTVKARPIVTKSTLTRKRKDQIRKRKKR